MARPNQLKVEVNGTPPSAAIRANRYDPERLDRCYRIEDVREPTDDPLCYRASQQQYHCVGTRCRRRPAGRPLHRAGGERVIPRLYNSFNIFGIPAPWHMGRTLAPNPYYVGMGMPERVDALASAAGAFNLFISIVVSCGFLLGAAYSLAHHDLYGVAGWLSQVLCCWGIFYGGYLTSTYRTLHNFVTLSRIQVYQTLLNFGMVFSLPFIGFYGLCARVGFPSFLSVWLYHRSRPLKVNYRFDKKVLWELIRIGLPFSFWGTFIHPSGLQRKAPWCFRSQVYPTWGSFRSQSLWLGR